MFRICCSAVTVVLYDLTNILNSYNMYRMCVLTVLLICMKSPSHAQDEKRFTVWQESYERRSYGASTQLNVTFINPAEFDAVVWYYGERQESNLIANLAVSVSSSRTLSFQVNNNFFEFRMNLTYQYPYMESTCLMTLLISELHEKDAQKKIIVLLAGVQESEVQIQLDVAACPDLQDTTHELVVNYSNDRNYLSKAEYECRRGSLFVAGSLYQSEYKRSCSETAEWEPEGDGECWYDPSMIEAVQLKFSENELLMLRCNFSNDGNPLATKYNFSFDGVNYESTMQDFHVDGRAISWKDNRKTFSCGLVSQYSLANGSAGRSSTQEFSVFFGVKNLTGVAFRYIPKNSTGKFSVTIYANPENGEVQAGMFDMAGDNVSDEMAQTLQRNDTEYVYTYSLDRSKIPEKHFMFNAVTTDPPSNVSIHINIVDEPPVTTTDSAPFDSTGGPGSDLPTYVIPVVICAAVLCLILIVVLVFMIRRRQKKHAHGGDTSDRRAHEPSTSDDANREERANPLYGISHQEREERVNPLYGSSGGAMMGDDIYSEVKKDKKGKKKGKENKGYSGENVGDMYAEVKKPKKNAPKPTVSEVTYAAVDKKTKKGASQNSLHGSPVA